MRMEGGKNGRMEEDRFPRISEAMIARFKYIMFLHYSRDTPVSVIPSRLKSRSKRIELITSRKCNKPP